LAGHARSRGKIHGGGYERSAYQLIPLFVNRIPIDEFVKAATAHPNEAIRSQAAIYIQQCDGFTTVRDQVLVDGTLLQAEERYPDVYAAALRTLPSYGQAGVEVLFALCEQSETEFRQVALEAALRLKDRAYAERFIAAEQAADAALREMASAWLDQHSADLTPDQQSARANRDTPK
jgi:hypothetical protein